MPNMIAREETIIFISSKNTTRCVRLYPSAYVEQYRGNNDSKFISNLIIICIRSALKHMVLIDFSLSNGWLII